MCPEIPAMPARLTSQKPLTKELGRHRQSGRLRIRSMKASTFRIARNPANRQILQCGAGRITSLLALPCHEESPCMHHRVVSNHIELAKGNFSRFQRSTDALPCKQRKSRRKAKLESVLPASRHRLECHCSTGLRSLVIRFVAYHYAGFQHDSGKSMKGRSLFCLFPYLIGRIKLFRCIAERRELFLPY